MQVRTSTGKRVPLQIGQQDSVAELKVRLSDAEGIKVEELKLIWQGKQMDDDSRLGDLGISDGDAVYLELRLRGC